MTQVSKLQEEKDAACKEKATMAATVEGEWVVIVTVYV